jgi:hypothetical protein
MGAPVVLRSCGAAELLLAEAEAKELASNSVDAQSKNIHNYSESRWHCEGDGQESFSLDSMRGGVSVLRHGVDVGLFILRIT